MTRWFGPTWGAPVNDEGQEVAVPVGRKCWAFQCAKPIEPGDRGICVPAAGSLGYLEQHDWVALDDHRHVVYHLACFLREVVGHDVAVGVPHDQGLREAKPMIPPPREGAAAVARRRLAEQRKETP